MSRKSWIKSALRVVVVGLMTLVAGGVLVLQAQGKPGKVDSGNPFDQLGAKLDQILAIVTPATVSRSVVLSTPFVNVAPGQLSQCSVANVGTTTIARVDVRMLLANGTIYAAPGPSLNVPPGQGFGAGVSSGVTSAFIRCEVIFEGTAAAVRANLLVIAAGNTLVSVDAR